MKVSTKGRYGLRALVDLACNSDDNHVSLVQIAERQNLSLNYLEQVFSTLRKAGIIHSLKGAQGGYCLAKPPVEISVGEVLRALEGEFLIVDSERGPGEDPVKRALHMLVWNRINTEVQDYMYSRSLQDLVEEYQKLNV